MKKNYKEIRWMGSSKDDLVAQFPEEIRSEAGKELRSLQFGNEPKNAEGLPRVGAGAFEVKFKDKDGWYRVILVSKFDKAIYILHSFKKKTNETPKSDIDLAKVRYAAAKADAGVR